MFYDENRGNDWKNSDDSAPKKRKRISTGGERYEKVRIGSSPDGQRSNNPRYNNDRNRDKDFNNDRSSNYNSDRNTNYNTERKPRYNSDRYKDSDNYGNRDTDFNRERTRDDSYGNRDRNYNRERNYNRDSDNYGNRDENYNSERNSSRYGQRSDSRDGFQKKSYGSSGKSYGSGEQRGSYKKSYGSQDGNKGYVKRGDKPFGKPGFKKPGDRFGSRPQRQPEYHFDEEPDNSPVRLNKFIANTGLCSRREADEHIQAGLITVNGNLITELGVKVLPTDDIRYNGTRLTPEKKVYILLNKPKDYVTSVDDPHAKRTIMELVKGACKERIYPVGRLDRMTTGVILLTNDGELTKKLTHPTSEIKKIYHVHLDKNVNPEDVDAIAEGITLDDGFIKADNVGYIREEDRNLLGIEIHSGRNRIVRRIFEHFGYKVTRLDRIFFGGLTKKGLSRGKWRYLAPKEVGFLKMLKV